MLEASVPPVSDELLKEALGARLDCWGGLWWGGAWGVGRGPLAAGSRVLTGWRGGKGGLESGTTGGFLPGVKAFSEPSAASVWVCGLWALSLASAVTAILSVKVCTAAGSGPDVEGSLKSQAPALQARVGYGSELVSI